MTDLHQSESILRLLENLQRQIDEKDQQIYDLQEQLEKANYWADKHNWFRPRELPESSLPVPRLQIELISEDEYNHEWLYSIVYRHTLGYIEAIPFGLTKVSGSGRIRIKPSTQEEIEQMLPFRDGFHIRKDSKSLGLPAYGIVPSCTPFLLSPL